MKLNFNVIRRCKGQVFGIKVTWRNHEYNDFCVDPLVTVILFSHLNLSSDRTPQTWLLDSIQNRLISDRAETKEERFLAFFS